MTIRINNTIYTMYLFTYVKDAESFVRAFVSEDDFIGEDMSLIEFTSTKLYKSYGDKEKIECLLNELYYDEKFIVDIEENGYAIFGLRQEKVLC